AGFEKDTRSIQRIRRRQSRSGYLMNSGSSETPWAIITGASSGIGKALAFEFAAGGYNLLLIARNEATLADVAAVCSTKFRIEAEVPAADLSNIEAVERVVQRLTAPPTPRRYEVLVNNAGFTIHGGFDSVEIEPNIQLVNLQLTAALKLTRAVLP